MVRPIELIVGLVLLPWALWSFWYPRKDFELGKKIGFLGIRNRQQLELNRFGLLRHRIGTTILFLAVFLIVDSIYLLT